MFDKGLKLYRCSCGSIDFLFQRKSSLIKKPDRRVQIDLKAHLSRNQNDKVQYDHLLKVFLLYYNEERAVVILQITIKHGKLDSMVGIGMSVIGLSITGLIGGLVLLMQALTDLQLKTNTLLRDEAEKIERLIAVQLENLTLPKCPLYEEVLDTQMFGLSRQIDLAVKLGLIQREEGQEILNRLERKLANLFSRALTTSAGKSSN